MPSKYETNTAALRAAADEVSSKFGAALVEALENAAVPLLSWLEYLRKWRLTGVADELLVGTQSAIIETAACLSLGLVRPALFSMRAEIDMCLSWLFFKDHPVEWERVQSEGEGFKFKKDVITYLEQHVPKFRERFALLRNHKRGTAQDPYRLLSAHVHSQSSATVPGSSDLASIVCSEAVCRECVSIQSEVSEYLNDVIFSFAPEVWPDVPDAIKTDFQARLAAPEQSQFFA